MAKLDISELSKMKGIEMLTSSEVVECNGGESLWYWIAYAAGSAAKAAKYVWDKHTEAIMEQGGHISTMPFK